MKPAPTSSLFPLITPSAVPLVRRECTEKESEIQEKTESGEESEMTREKRKKEIKCASDT